jgi:16S rRNA (adenine1518-N6/adenine1519-N6)-dimethyltransferase
MPHPKAQLEGTGIQPKKSFGQNFLADDTHLKKIAALTLALSRDRVVVEMGAGLGALTAHLLAGGATVHAVERDRDLVPLLQARFAGEEKLTVHEDNALTFPLDALANGGALAGNLPYHHAAQIATRALSAWPNLGGACFLVQLEVGERMAAKSSTKAYGSLTIALQSRFDVTLAHVVPKGAFWPVPDVDGGVITMRSLSEPRGAAHDLAQLENLARTAFQKRRKTIKNALGLDDDTLRAAGIDPKARPEDVDVASWARLASQR